MNRLKILKVAHQFLHSLLTAKFSAHRCVADPLPDDAVLVAVNSDGRTLFLTYQSTMFEEVGEGEMIPELMSQYQIDQSRVKPSSIAQVLNEALDCDPSAISSLVLRRTPCNRALLDHPTIVCDDSDGDTVGMIGLINGCIAQSEKVIGYTVDEGLIVAFHALPKLPAQ